MVSFGLVLFLCGIFTLSCAFKFSVKDCSKFYKLRNEIWPRGYKLFSCSVQLSMKFVLLIHVKMPTIVGILTFISRINTTSECLIHKLYLFLKFGFHE